MNKYRLSDLAPATVERIVDIICRETGETDRVFVLRVGRIGALFTPAIDEALRQERAEMGKGK